MNFISESNFKLSKDDCEYIINLFENSTDKQIEGRIGNESIKKDTKDSTDITVHLEDIVSYPEWIKCTEIIFSGLLKQIEIYKEEYPSVNLLDKWKIDNCYNIQRYFPGQGFYKFHCENTQRYYQNRVLAWMIYLNDVTDGGGTEFLDQKLIINAEQGKVVIWPAGWTHMHRGIVSSTQTKYIATGWYVVEEK